MEPILGAGVAPSPTLNSMPTYELSISSDSAQALANTFNKTLEQFLVQFQDRFWKLQLTMSQNQTGNDWNWIDIFLSCLTVIIAFLALLAAWKANQTSKNSLQVSEHSLQLSKYSFSSEILKLFFEVIKEFPLEDDTKPLSRRQRELFCNYLEFVCYLREKKRFAEEDMKLIELILSNPTFAQYAKEYQEIHGPGYFSSYLNRLTKNKPKK